MVFPAIDLAARRTRTEDRGAFPGFSQLTILGNSRAERASRLCQRLVEVGNQIIDVLDADRESHQAIVDADGGTLRRGNGGMRHQCGMLDQAFHAAEASSLFKTASSCRWTAPHAGGFV